MATTAHHPRLLTIAVAVGAGLLTAACGTQGESAIPLSKPDFVAQANRICEAGNDQLDVVFEDVYAGLDDIDMDDPDNELLIFERWDAALIEARPLVDRELDDIGALEPPADDAEFIETLLADQAAAFAEFTRLMKAAADGDRAALVALETEVDPFHEIDRRAREYGLTACGGAD